MKRVPFIPKLTIIIAAAATAVVILYACSGPATNTNNVLAGNAASKVYVAPGQYDEYYAFLSGGYNGQVMAYGLPSGRLLKLIGVFSQNPETGWGYNEETKPMLQTTYGFVPWDDTHHAELSQTNGVPDARSPFITVTHTPRGAALGQINFHTI